MNSLPGLLALLFFVLQLLAVPEVPGADFVSPTEIRRWQENKISFYLIDVRTAQLFDRKHIAGALNIPAFVVHKKGIPRDETIVLYDSGIGSVEAGEASSMMAAADYGKVFLLEGGLAYWEAAGLPLEAKAGILDTRLVEFISVAELLRARRDGIDMILVDLREPALFEDGSIPGARNIPPAALPGASAAWPKDRLVVLFDGGEGRSEKQAELLRRAGFKLIRFLYGGFPEWKRQNAS